MYWVAVVLLLSFGLFGQATLLSYHNNVNDKANNCCDTDSYKWPLTILMSMTENMMWSGGGMGVGTGWQYVQV